MPKEELAMVLVATIAHSVQRPTEAKVQVQQLAKLVVVRRWMQVAERIPPWTLRAPRPLVAARSLRPIAVR
jgi:hypothetical protein